MKDITFINKTAKSVAISRSTPDERRRINERNREHRHWRKGSTRVTPQSDIVVKAENWHVLTSPIFANSPTTTADQPSIVALSDDNSSTKSTQLVCPLTGINIGGLGDPFDTFSIPLTAAHWRVIQFYRDIYYKRLWVTVSAILRTLLGNADLSRCSPEVVIRECLQIPSRMWSLLASASCNLQHETNVKGKSLLLVESGTASLRDDLQNSELDRHSLLNSIHLHLAAKSLQQDHVAEAHLKGARAILRELVNRGAVIPPPTLGVAALVDSQLAARMLAEKADRVRKEADKLSSSHIKLVRAPQT